MSGRFAISFFEIEDNRFIRLYLKRKWFKTYKQCSNLFDFHFGKTKAYCGCSWDFKGKYIIVTFALREDINEFMKRMRDIDE